MTNVVIIAKNGDCTTKNVKQLNLDTIYKCVNLKSAKDFKKLHTWKVKKTGYVHIYGKVNGRSTTINKFELPPPIDTPLYYGSLCLIKTDEKALELENVIEYSAEQWNKDYETLMGGFEDINDEDSYESDELDEYPDECITDEGYLKDGFVVETDDNGDDDDIEGGSSDEETAGTSVESDGEDEYGEEGDVSDDEDDVSDGSEEDYDSDDYMSELEEEEYSDED